MVRELADARWAKRKYYEFRCLLNSLTMLDFGLVSEYALAKILRKSLYNIRHNPLSGCAGVNRGKMAFLGFGVC